jgi:polyisoprenoid-binding protein YceI
MKRFYLILVGLLIGLGLSSTAFAQQTWYTLQGGGDWDKASTWTLDPAGQIQVSSAVPSAEDNVVILSGATVTVPDGEAPYDDPLRNVSLDCKLVTINGELDLRASAGHTFSELKGTGRLLMAADNYPTITTDDSDFTSKGEGEGTVVFYGNDLSISSSYTFYNLEVDMNSGQTLSLESDLSLNGSLVVSGGYFGINNGGTTSRSVTVNGDVTVVSTGGITVGGGDTFHLLNVYGDFTNKGTVDFSNSAQYTEAGDGAVKLKFLGSSENEFVCNGTTNLYRLFVDKGTDKTFKLSVNADQNTNFNLYGPVTGTTSDASDGAAGWQRLPIVIENGTLELGSNIVIDRLGENISGTAPNEFTIPETGQLIVNGANVTTSASTGDWKGLTIYGKLKVNEGTLTTPAGTNGLYYATNGGTPQLEVNGGTANLTQIRPYSDAGKFTYTQSGG